MFRCDSRCPLLLDCCSLFVVGGWLLFVVCCGLFVDALCFEDRRCSMFAVVRRSLFVVSWW